MRKQQLLLGVARIGAGLVEAFVKRGYNVVANSRNITKANPFAAAAMLHWLMETSATQARPQRLWILPYRVLADRCADKQCGCFIPKPFTDTPPKTSTL